MQTVRLTSELLTDTTHGINWDTGLTLCGESLIRRGYLPSELDITCPKCIAERGFKDLEKT